MPKLAALLLVFLLFLSVRAQESPSPSPEASPTAIPLAEIGSELERAARQVSEMQEQLGADPATASIGSELPTLTQAIDRQQAELTALTRANPSLEALRNLEEQWRGLARQVAAWLTALSGRADHLGREVERLNELEATWTATLAEAQAPQALLERTRGLLTQIATARGQVELRLSSLLALQDLVSAQDKRVQEALEVVRGVREQAVSRIWRQDSPPLWDARSFSTSFSGVVAGVSDAVRGQWELLGSYARMNGGAFILHLGLFGVLALALTRVSRRVHPDDPGGRATWEVFRSPLSLAIILAVWLSGSFYPDAPPILETWLVALAIIPIGRLLMRLTEPRWRPVLTFLVAMFFVDQVRGLVSAVPEFSRLLLLAQLMASVAFFYWRRLDFAEHRLTRLASRVVVVVLGVAILANVVGFVALSTLLGTATLQSLYLAMVLYAVLSIADGLIWLAMQIWPLNRLEIVKRHPGLVRARLHAALRFLALLIWALATLESLTLLRPLWQGGASLMATSLSLGSLQLRLGDVLAFFLIVWASFLISRLIRFLLQEDVYPRLDLGRGVPYALSAVTHYAVLLIGFLIAMAALGVDINRFTVLAGALGVGIGFGLQNIVNNFVSGLILLFERPVKVGDFIRVGEFSGTLTRIGLRASLVRMWDGSDVIVPNGDMISNQVTNWTLGQAQRRVDIKLGVSYDSDPCEVIEILERVAGLHPHVLSEPAPEGLMLEFGDNALLFQLRATTHESNWARVRSDLMVAVYEALSEAGIEMPFPQRTLHLNEKQLRRLSGRVQPDRDRPQRSLEARDR